MGEKCLACLKPMRNGDKYFNDASGGVLHAEALGPERESYVNADGDPLGPDDPIPEPSIWSEGADEEEGASDQ